MLCEQFSNLKLGIKIIRKKKTFDLSTLKNEIEFLEKLQTFKKSFIELTFDIFKVGRILKNNDNEMDFVASFFKFDIKKPCRVKWNLLYHPDGIFRAISCLSKKMCVDLNEKSIYFESFIDAVGGIILIYENLIQCIPALKYEILHYIEYMEHLKKYILDNEDVL